MMHESSAQLVDRLMQDPLSAGGACALASLGGEEDLPVCVFDMRKNCAVVCVEEAG